MGHAFRQTKKLLPTSLGILVALSTAGCFSKGGGGSGAHLGSGATNNANSTQLPLTLPPSEPPAGTLPSATISSPTANPYYSNSLITISGNCTSGNIVSLGGSVTASNVIDPVGSLTMPCTGSYSFSISHTSDGTYDLSIIQRDSAGNTSPPVSQTWILDQSAPTAPTIVSPSFNPYTSGESGITLSGACENGATVNLAGVSPQTIACASGTYSFNVSESADGSYTYNVFQIDLAGNTSSAATFQWTRNTLMPTPTLSSPAVSPYYSSSGSLVLSGACSNGNTVTLAGSSSSSATCIDSMYSFTVNESADGQYDYMITQQDSYGNSSAIVQQRWFRDSVAPVSPTVLTPATRPFSSGDIALVIQGGCESNSTVNLSGATTASTLCTGGNYSFNFSPAADGTYLLSLSQTDMAGNSSAAADLQWTRDTSIPTTPTIAAPANNPVYSNQSQLTLSGACSPSNLVILSGDVIASDVFVPVNSLTLICNTSGTYSFTIAKTVDGSYGFDVKQQNMINANYSGTVSIAWIRDLLAPVTPIVINPASNPYIGSGNLLITGSCEDLATVHLSGSATQSTACTAGNYSFTVIESVDGPYNFSIHQADRAGNVSGSAPLTWNRVSSAPPTPSIITPPINPFYSNGSSLTIAGGCQTGLTVTLGGVPASAVTNPVNSLTQTCVNSQYSFVISETVDGAYNFTVMQTYLGVDSGMIGSQWVRDTVAPSVTITSNPANPNLSVLADFVFTSTDAPGMVTFACSLDGGAYAPCASAASYTQLSNASHTFSIQATDLAGNVGSASYTWAQAAFNAVALYHFDTTTTPPSMADSGLYAGVNNNVLTNFGSTSTGTFKFGGAAQRFNSGSSQYASTANKASQAVVAGQMTVEGWARFSSLPTTYMTIASKGGASGQFSWKYGVKKVGAQYFIFFQGSLDGVTYIETLSSAIALGTGVWNHIAVTWNKGSVQFFLNGVSVGMGTIGTVGSSVLFNSNGNLYISREQAGNYFNGRLDELRISQIVRWSANFTPPAAAYSAD